MSNGVEVDLNVSASGEWYEQLNFFGGSGIKVKLGLGARRFLIGFVLFL